MSAEAVQWAFGLTDGIDVLEKLVLLSLADDTSEDGWVLFRSIERLARRSCSSVDDVKGALVHLQQRGLIDLGCSDIEAARFPRLGEVLVGSELP